MAQQKAVIAPRAIRKRDADRARHAILTAARREFAQHGYQGARIEKIVKAADCNIRLPDLYVTIKALSRFHLANAFSLSALLGTDLTRAEWGQTRLMRSRQLFRAYLTDRTSEAAP